MGNFNKGDKILTKVASKSVVPTLHETGGS